ncbi:hypothetical protein HJFPF1_13652 [Paramyrothecium foliicola]|nr:hypothetical protein HJFPF1_13652 [Paramyrothecium foliicola]
MTRITENGAAHRGSVALKPQPGQGNAQASMQRPHTIERRYPKLQSHMDPGGVDVGYGGKSERLLGYG